MIELPNGLQGARYSIYGRAVNSDDVQESIMTTSGRANIHYTAPRRWNFIVLDEDLVATTMFERRVNIPSGSYIAILAEDITKWHRYDDLDHFLEEFDITAQRNINQDISAMLEIELISLNEKFHYEHKIDEALKAGDEAEFIKLLNTRLSNGMLVRDIFKDESSSMEVYA
ncbi:hypothetical protein D3C79_806450 [compost metagenome]